MGTCVRFLVSVLCFTWSRSFQTLSMLPQYLGIHINLDFVDLEGFVTSVSSIVSGCLPFSRVLWALKRSDLLEIFISEWELQGLTPCIMSGCFTLYLFPSVVVRSFFDAIYEYSRLFLVCYCYYFLSVEQ